MSWVGRWATSPNLQVKTIKIGAEGVSIFLGDGLADYDIDDDIATYMSDEHPATVLTSETVGNIIDGKIYRLVGASLTSPNLTTQNYGDATVWRPVAATYLAGESPLSVAVGRDGRRLGRDGRDLPGVQADELGVRAERRAIGDCGGLRGCQLGRAAPVPQRRRHPQRRRDRRRRSRVLHRERHARAGARQRANSTDRGGQPGLHGDEVHRVEGDRRFRRLRRPRRRHHHVGHPGNHRRGQHG